MAGGYGALDNHTRQFSAYPTIQRLVTYAGICRVGLGRRSATEDVACLVGVPNYRFQRINS